MEFRLLGPLVAVDGKREIAPQRKKQRALLAVLALRAGELVTSDRLIEDLWGEQPPRAALGSLQNLVSELRKTLGADVLATRAPGYVLDVGRDAVDVHRFADLVARAREERDPATRVQLLREALGLWRGAALADVAFEPFADIEIARLDELQLAAREDLVDAELRLGRHTEVIDEIVSLIAAQPFRERPRGLLMLALYRAGRQADALEAFAAARRFLREELGLEPSPALAKLQAAILRQDPALDPPTGGYIGSLAGEERRKVVTVTYTDVVDSTALGAELDPESYRGVLRRYGRSARAVLESHGGIVEKFIGDAVVGVFGVPERHEDDALRAVRAAVDLRGRMGDLNAELQAAHGVTIEIRTGINTGEAIAGEEDAAQSFATGYAVNVGAKLQQAAGAGGILIGPSTYELVRNAVETEPGEPLVLGRTSLPTFRVTSVAVSSPGVGRHLGTQLVGRNEELATLRRVFEEACEERGCRHAIVLGEAGIGKSRLAHELAATIAGQATVLVGGCVSYGEGATYQPVAELVRQVVPDGSEAGIASLLGDDRDARLIGRRVRELLGWEEGAPPAGEGFWAVRRLLGALARAKPLLLVLDDVHWAEPTLLDLVDHVVAQSREAPILVLCIARPDLVDARPDWPVLIQLEPLSDSESGMLVDNLSTAVPDALRDRIVEVAEGNALFAEQLHAYALEHGDDALDAVPASVEALLASRLDRLPESERATLERAAVIGRDFWPGAVRALAERDVAGDLRALAERGLVRPARSLLEGEDALRFHHALIRDVAYAGATKERRSRLHERTADWLDEREPGWDAIIGYHLEQAYRLRRQIGALDDETAGLAARAGTRLAGAGMRAFQRTDIRSAVNLLDLAVELLPTGEHRAEILCELALARLTAGDPRGRSDFERARELAAQLGSTRLQLRAEIEIASAGVVGAGGFSATPEDVLTIASQALPILEKLEDDRTLARVWLALAGVHSHRLHNEAWEEAAARALTYYRRAGWPGGTSLMGQAAALFWGPTATTDALRRIDVLLDESDGDLWAIASVNLFRAALLAMRGRFHDAREALSGSRETFTELGSTVQIATNWSGMAAEIERLSGDLDARETILRASLEDARSLEQGAFVATRAAQLADVLHARGRHGEAQELANVAERHLAEGDLVTHVKWQTVSAKLLGEEGQTARAVAVAREAHHRMQDTDALDLRAQVTLDLAEVVRLADPSGAESGMLIRDALALLRRKGNHVSAQRADALLQAPATA